MKNKKIVIAGGAGFIGQALAARWGRDNEVVILSRQTAGARNNSYGRKPLQAEDGYRIVYRHWDGKRVERQWAAELDGCDLVVNLAGRSVNCRYTDRNKQEIFDSRTDPTAALGQAIRAAIVPPKLWINAASATIYRYAEDRPQDEYNGEIGHGFSVEVCKRWEQCFLAERTPFTRKIALRTAITLGNEGVIVPYLHLLKFGLGGRQGSGRQMYSWVHIEARRPCHRMAARPTGSGRRVQCGGCPGAVTNSVFMATLRRLMHHPFGLPAPACAPCSGLGAGLIGTETELVLKSRWVLPTRLLEAGFRFQYERIDSALEDIIRQTPRNKYRLL